MRIAYLDCFSGISGDMLLGALVDAGVPFSLLEQTAAALGVGARIQMRKVLRGGLSGTKVDVIAPESALSASPEPPTDEHQHAHSHPHEHHHHPEADAGHRHDHNHAPHRSLSSILGLIRSAPLADNVKARASRAFDLLGHAEAGIHSIPVEQVHFHEVGAVDTIVDIVCAAAGCESLGVERWMASPLNVGSGTVECSHGTLPVPAPATLALLGAAPVYSAGSPMERVTPTGAALLSALDVRYEALPAMRIQAHGYGAGGRYTPGTPNLLRLLIGESTEQSAEQSPEQTAAGMPQPEPIVVTETVVDDATPQLLAYVSELLLEAGAWDVYRMPVQMKKGRSGVQITVLSSPQRAAAVRDLLLRETTTIGLRWRTENKLALAREFAEVETPWGRVRIKIARWAAGASAGESVGDVANAAPEYEDCRALARQHAVPLKRVMQEAMRAWANSIPNSIKDGR